MTASASRPSLDQKLSDYSEGLGAPESRRRQTWNQWPVYAAAMGSSLACATTAAADSITYQVVGQRVQLAGIGGTTNNFAFLFDVDGGGDDFRVRGFYNNSGGSIRNWLYVENLGGSSRKVLRSGNIARQLGAGSAISSGLPGWGNNGRIRRDILYPGGPAGYGWTVGAEGFVGLQVGSGFGWLRLALEPGPDAFGNPRLGAYNIVDWAFNSEGAITAGEGAFSEAQVPEPSSLALLAAGAAGLVALRRRRNRS